MRLRRELCVCRRPPRHAAHLTTADETPTAPTARATGAITIKPACSEGQHTPSNTPILWRGPLSPGLVLPVQEWAWRHATATHSPSCNTTVCRVRDKTKRSFLFLHTILHPSVTCLTSHGRSICHIYIFIINFCTHIWHIFVRKDCMKEVGFSILHCTSLGSLWGPPSYI